VLPQEVYDAIVLGVAHSAFLDMDLSLLQKPDSVIYDVKGVLGKKAHAQL